MEGDRILRCVKSVNRDAADLITSIQAYLGPVLCGGGRDTKEGKYAKFSRKLLKECIDQHRGADNHVSSHLLDAASIAIDCLKKVSPATSGGDRIFEKLLFNFARECFSVGQYERGRNASLLCFERLDSPSVTVEADTVEFLKQLFNLLWNAALKAEEGASPDPELCLDMKRVALLAGARADFQPDFILPRLLKADTRFHKATAGTATSLSARHRFHSLLAARLASSGSLRSPLPCKTRGLHVEILARFSLVSGMVGSVKDSERLMKTAKSLQNPHTVGGGGPCQEPLCCTPCLSAAAIVHTTEIVLSLLHHHHHRTPQDGGASSFGRPNLVSLQDLCSAVRGVASSVSSGDKMADLDAVGRLTDAVELLVSVLEQRRQEAGGWRRGMTGTLPLTRTTFDLLRALFESHMQLRSRLLTGAQAKSGGGGCGSAEGAEVALKCRKLYLLNILQEMLVDLLQVTNDSRIVEKIEGEGEGEEVGEDEEGEDVEEIELPRSASARPPVDPLADVASLCLPLLEESRRVLEEAGQCGRGIPEEEHRWLGCSAYNLGVMLHRCGVCGEAIHVLDLACDEMGIWCGGKEERMVEVNLLEKQCLLASYLREVSLYAKALDTLVLAVTAGVLEDPRRRCGLVAQWARVRAAALDDGVKDVEGRTFMSALKPLKGVPLSTVSSCLEVELAEYKEVECDDAVVLVVEELLEVYRCEGRVLDRTRILTEQAILNRKTGDRHSLDFFTDIAGILQSLEKSEKSNRYALVGQLATVNFWKSVCIYDQLMERCGQSDPPPASLPSSSEDGGTAEGEEDQLRLTSEEAKALVSTDSLVRCLEVAVNHWDTLSQIPMQSLKNGDLSQDRTTFELVMVASYMCVVHHRPLLAIRALAALVRMYEALPRAYLQAHYHNALAMKARLLSGCGVPAEVLLDSLETSSEAPPTSSSPPPCGKALRSLTASMLHTKLSLAAIKLTNDELDGCRGLLVEVLSHPHLTSTYPSSYMVQARAKMLASSLLQRRAPTPLLTPGKVLDHLEATPTTLLHPHFTLTPLEVAMDALRLFRGVVSGDAHRKGEESQKRASVEVRGWEVFEGLLEGLKMAAELHCSCGMVREAYHYGREGLKLAKSKALRYWAVTFYLILAEVSVVKGNLPVARRLICQAGQLFDPAISPNSSIDAYLKVIQSCPTHFQLCIDLLMATLRLGEAESEVGGSAPPPPPPPPPVPLPQDVPRLLAGCASALDPALSRLCSGGDGDATRQGLPWFSSTQAHLCAELEGSLLQARAHRRAGEVAKCLTLCRQCLAHVKKQAGRCVAPAYREHAARLYVAAGTCVEFVRETKAKVKLTKQDDAVEYFLMAFQLCFPCSSVLLLRETCLSLGSSVPEASPLLAGHFLSLGMQLTLTCQAMYSIGHKLRSRDRNDTRDVIATLQCSGQASATPTWRARQSFPPLHATMPPVGYTRQALDSLPPTWTLCTLGVDPSERYLMVMRAGRERDPLMVRISLPEQNIPGDHQQCMMSSKDSLTIKDKKKWWAVRRELDSSLETLCGDLEDVWLGHWKCLLVGKSSDERTHVVERVCEQLKQGVDRKWVELLVETWGCLSQEEVCSLLGEVAVLGEVADDPLTAAQRKQAYSTIEELLPSEATPSHHPMVLVAGHTLQCLPWESIPVLRERAVCRMPSLAFVVAHRNMLGHDWCGLVNPLSTFYVLNPEKNLPKTEKCFEWFTKEPGWEGVVGKEPSDQLLKEALEQHQLYIYCGHGSGGKYLSTEQLHLVHCKAASVLMGCSSGRLAVHGSADPSGVVLQYLISGCPAIVANLWDVTDEDIDRYCECLLDNWLSGSEEPLLKHASSARSVCKLKYLIGASPVVYGIPVCTSGVSPKAAA